MRIAVMGTGGVGGYFGAMLARAGQSLHLRGVEAGGRAGEAARMRVAPPVSCVVHVPADVLELA